MSEVAPEDRDATVTGNVPPRRYAAFYVDRAISIVTAMPPRPEGSFQIKRSGYWAFVVRPGLDKTDTPVKCTCRVHRRQGVKDEAIVPHGSRGLTRGLNQQASNTCRTESWPNVEPLHLGGMTFVPAKRNAPSSGVADDRDECSSRWRAIRPRQRTEFKRKGLELERDVEFGGVLGEKLTEQSYIIAMLNPHSPDDSAVRMSISG